MTKNARYKILTGIATAGLAVASLFTAQQREPATILSKDANIQYTYTNEQGTQVYGVLDDESMDSIAMAKTKNTMVVKTSAFIAYGEEPPDNPTYLPVIVRKVSTSWPANHSRTGYWRPAPGGVSTGHPAITYGTIGDQVTYQGNTNCFITNAHVAGGLDGGKIGDPMLQPGAHHGGTQTIGYIVAMVTPLQNVTNSVDVAVVCGERGDIYPGIYSIGQVSGVYEHPYVGMVAVKCGATSGCTVLTLEAMDVTIKIGYMTKGSREPVMRTFAHQMMWSGNSGPGDSGSLIVGSNKMISLLFAGNEDEHRVMGNDPVYLLKAIPGLMP